MASGIGIKDYGVHRRKVREDEEERVGVEVPLG